MPRPLLPSFCPTTGLCFALEYHAVYLTLFLHNMHTYFRYKSQGAHTREPLLLRKKVSWWCSCALTFFPPRVIQATMQRMKTQKKQSLGAAAAAAKGRLFLLALLLVGLCVQVVQGDAVFSDGVYVMDDKAKCLDGSPPGA